MADCKACGHRDTQHTKFGCNQGICKCELSKQDVIDFDKLTTLREAGEKMAEALRHNKRVVDLGNPNNSWAFIDEDAAALEAWEAANK